MKHISTFFLLFFVLLLSAQMDTEHWFAPMKANHPNEENYQAVYLSTSETTAFDVKIYSGTSLLGTVNLKKGAPQTFVVPRENIITEKDTDCNAMLQQKGLHLIGDKKFFATLRFSVPNHAEIVTSKGKAALGKEFFLGMPLAVQSNVKSNYTASILATENGTSVTLSGYNPEIKFTNDSSVSPTKNIILNKGESYIFEVDEDLNVGKKGLIGAKIDADKPISVSNGIFSGRISNDGVDIFMDQSVPVEKTGEEFIVMGGNGNFPNSAIESTLIIATKDDTDVFLNDISTVKYHLAKAGDFVFVPSQLYQTLDAANKIYALYIKTNKNAYVYEILAGSASQEKPSGGMNLIPALSCFLPYKIDEISEVNHLPLSGTGIGNKDYHDVKLNILAQQDAALTVNGAANDLLGPFDIAGSNWKVYSKLKVSGNQTVESNNKKAITAGIAGGSGPAGFGGYFAGFSSIPSISKSGACATGQTLEVDDFYDEYKWFYSIDNANWETMPDTTYQIHPGTKIGYYKAIVTKYSCSPPQKTKEFKYLKCPTLSEKVFPIGACNNIEITPEFSIDKALIPDPAKTTIIIQPAGGKAYVGTDGKIYFDANETTEEQVTFTYYLEQKGANFPEYEEVTVTVNIDQIKSKDAEAISCLNRGGFGTYNLKNSFESLNTNLNFSFDYYTDASFTQQIPVSEIEHYSSKPGATVYVKITNQHHCNNHLNPGKIVLKTYPLPTITKIDVKGNTSADIYLEGGNKPYFIAVKKGKYDTNFEPEDTAYQEISGDIASVNLYDGKGYYTAFVKSADQCLPVIKYFTVIGINNTITPNGDGINDQIDVSGLQEKINPVFQIFDRFGKKIFEGTAGNNFTWDGKSGNFNLPTETYWYLMQWQDFPDAAPDVLQGWILLKNR